ncbi:MAG TPA: hypothetical protein VFP61_02615 [Acidimicrobiales bacterium]|nr:hypothetical protein [Acidimicrobiales bacterium]
MAEAEEHDSMERAWLQAAAQLRIRVTVPYVIPSNLGPARFAAYLPDFGGSKGMVVGPIRQDSDQGDTGRLAAGEAGFYFSQLADQYRSFDRELFIDTLNDWGWFGRDDAKPDWYTGEPWD